jgi:diguanylate cyclase (GGDEF)-like protein/PAS domain S-box-containing protein
MTQPSPHRKPPLILIVEDDHQIRAGLADAMAELNYAVREADNGQSALCQCEQEYPDLILLDAMMPVLNSFETCQRLRAMPGGADIPVLMVTAWSDLASVEHAFAAGVTDFIEKPFNLHVLQQRVSRLLESRRVELERQAMAATLQRVNAELESRVRERTEELARANVLLLAELAERQRIETALLQSEERFRLLFEHSPDAILLMDPHDPEVRWPIVAANAAACRVNGYSHEELIGLSHDKLHVGPHTMPDDVLLERIRSHGTLKGTSTHRRKDGTMVSLEYAAALVTIDGRELVLGIDRDVSDRVATETALRESEARLRHLALFDPLTDLPNRALLRDRLGSALARQQREPGWSFAVLFLDLDHFKTLNDSLGHAAGDQFLAGISRRLETCVRPGDTVARLGGDEFVLLLEEISDAASAALVAERVEMALRAPFLIQGEQFFTSASIGIVMSGPEYLEPDDLLRDADDAMYRAKTAGTARHVIFEPRMHAATVARMEQEQALRHALAHQEFTLHYQPIVSLADNTVVAMEALVRWRHPERGLLLPGEFLPLVEETDMMEALGTWVLRAAGHQAAEWRQAGVTLNYVAVNISAWELGHSDIVARALHNGGSPLALLVLEVAEATLARDQSIGLEHIATLAGQEISIVVDNIGANDSRLSSFTELPARAIKLDRSLVRELPNTSAGAIVEAAIADAHSHHLPVVALGVETMDQLTWLRARGCDAAQGFALSRPLAPESLTDVLPRRVEAEPRAARA